MDIVGATRPVGGAVYLTRRSLLIGTGSAGAAAVLLTQSLTGRWLGAAEQPKAPPQPGRVVSAQQFGARGDGRSDDRGAIQAAIDAVARSGGGTVTLAAGTYIVSRQSDSPVAITLKSGVTIAGQGLSSVVKLKDGSGGHTINVTRERDCALRDLIIDGNRDRQPSTGHTFRSGGVDGLLLQNVLVRNAYHYGIGLQGGTNRNVTIDAVTIENCGGDGIDIKNENSANSGILITNVAVRRWGVRKDRDTQAAIDCRGPVRLANLRISEPGAEDSVGIRMRHGELRSPNGLGAHHASLNGFDVRMGAGRAQVGINVVARYVTVANGAVGGGRRGLVVQDNDFRGTAIRVTGCSETGILINAAESELDGDASILSDCRVDRCGGNGIEVEADDVQIVRCVSTGSRRHGLLIKDGANGTSVVGGDFSGNVAGRIANRGSNSRIAVLAS